MPVYEYISDAGQIQLLRRPVDQRDAPVLMRGVRYRRRTVPTSLMVGTGAKPPTMGERLTKGYRKLESDGKLTDQNPNYLPVKKIKEALALPDAH